MTQLARELITSGSILAACVFVAWLVSGLLAKLARRFGKSDGSLLADLLRALRIPSAGLIIIPGVYGALLQLLATQPHALAWKKWFIAAGTLLVVYAGSQAASLAIRWYVRSFDDPSLSGHATIYRKIVILAIWLFGGLLVLDQLQYEITAIVAGLGIAGLAIGLALQDTIANLFSGFYLMVDRSVRAGDYIKTDDGHEGFVEYVGWRNTRIRVWANNIVLIPNAKLIQSVITNYTLPSPVLSVYVWCGVSYDSDLEQVEKVSLAVAREIINSVPGADTSYDPVLRFKEFGDSNITFVIVMRATDVGAQYVLQHEFVKALHRGFKEEGIEISFPVRKLVFADDRLPQLLTSAQHEAEATDGDGQEVLDVTGD